MQNNRLRRINIIALHCEHRYTGEYGNVCALKNFLEKNNIEVKLFIPLMINYSGKENLCINKGEDLFLKIRLFLITLLKNNFGIENNDISIVFIPTPAFTWWGELLKIKGKKIIVFEASLFTAGFYNFLKDIYNDPIFYISRFIFNNSFFATIIKNKSDFYIVSTNLQRDRLVSLGFDINRVLVIPNMIDVEAFVDNNISNEILIFGNKKVVSYIGHFLYYKGIDIAIKVMKKLCELDDTIVPIIAWSGLGPKDRIIKLVRNTGYFERFILYDRVSVNNLLKASDVIILPYRYSCGTTIFPRILIEAFVAGTPVVISDFSIYREIVKDEISGISAKVNNIDDFVEKILKILNNKELAKKISANQKNIARQRFDVEIIGKKYLDLIAKL